MGLAAALAGAACVEVGTRAEEGEVPVIAVSVELARAPDRYDLAASTVVIGGLKDDVEDEFNHRNGFLSAAALSDGGLAVIDESKLRLFRRDGSQRVVLGRAGRGPGEVSGFSAVCVTRGDTVVAYDIFLRRVSIVGGEAAAMTQFTASAGALVSEGCFDDGTFLLHRIDEASGGALGGIVSRVNADGKVVAEVGVFPQMTQSVEISLTVARDKFWVGDPRTRELRRYDTNGRLDLVLRLRDELREMSIEEAEQRLPVSGARGGPSSRLSRANGEKTIAPLYERLMADGPDRLWIQMPITDFRQPSRWVRLDISGQARGYLELPGFDGEGMPPLIVQFIAGGAWVLHRDAEGVATFRYHEIVSP